MDIEEEEGLAECHSVIVERRQPRLVAWHGLDDDDGEGDREEGDNEDSSSPPEHLTAADDVAQIDVLVLYGGRVVSSMLTSFQDH